MRLHALYIDFITSVLLSFVLIVGILLQNKPVDENEKRTRMINLVNSEGVENEAPLFSPPSERLIVSVVAEGKGVRIYFKDRQVETVEEFEEYMRKNKPSELVLRIDESLPSRVPLRLLIAAERNSIPFSLGYVVEKKNRT